MSPHGFGFQLKIPVKCVVAAAANQISSFGPDTCTAVDPNGEGSEWNTMMPPMPMSCDAVEVRATAGQVLPAALVTDRQPNGNYGNSACQRWNVVSTEGQVKMTLLSIRKPSVHLFFFIHKQFYLDLDLQSMLILTQWPLYSNLTHVRSRCICILKMKFLAPAI